MAEHTLVASVSGALNGENDPDKSFNGDSINLETVTTFERVSGRVAYLEADLETTGFIDTSY